MFNMRIRVKAPGAPARVERVEVPNDPAATLSTLHSLVIDAFGLEEVEDVILSFNKRDPLVGRPDTPLRELGVCNGDLLWLLTPNVTTAAEAPEPATKRVRDADPLPQPQQAAPQQQQAAPQQQEQQQQQQEDKGKQPMVVDGEGEADAPVEQPPEPLPPSQRLPAYLLRTLEQSCSSACQPTDVALLAAHAALLETGFVPCWAADLLGSGAGADSSSVYQLPASCWVSASVCRVQYRLAPTNGNGSSAMEAEPAEPTAVAAGEQEQQPMQEGEQEEVEGAAAAAGPACTLQCSTLGGGAVVLAVATQAHSRHLALQATTYVQLLEAGASPAEAAAPVEAAVAGPSRSSSAAADAAAAPAASSSLVRLLPDGGLALGGCLRLGPAAAKQLWTRLKDGLAFPMLLAAYAEAGLAPPAGLLALPEELKQRVLEALGPQDLAALSCACSELRHLASQDALWQPLFQRDFPQAGQVYAMQARNRGWKWCYGQALRERRQREEALRRARARTFMPAMPMHGIPRPGFYPPPPPPGFPLMIGGDYDRLPQFGPNGGGLPGQFGGGAAFGRGLGGPPGPAFFGGGRRQGGRGSSGGYRMY